MVVAAAGVVVQIAAGYGYPPVPPVFFILLIPAALMFFGRWRWTPAVAILAGLFLTLGLFTSGAAGGLVDVSQHAGVAGSAGLWVQTLAVAVAVVAAVAATVSNYRSRSN